MEGLDISQACAWAVTAIPGAEGEAQPQENEMMTEEGYTDHKGRRGQKGKEEQQTQECPSPTYCSRLIAPPLHVVALHQARVGDLRGVLGGTEH